MKILISSFLIPMFMFFLTGHSFAQKKQKDIRYKIGDNIKVGNFEYIIDSYKFTSTIGDEFMQTKADGIYLIVDLRIKNISKETRTVDNSLFCLFDSHGNKFETSNEGTTALEMNSGKSLFLKEIHPNISTSGKLVFEVPTQEDHYLLQVTGGFWSAKIANIQIL